MAAIDEIQLPYITTKESFAAALWVWIEDHRRDVVISFRFLFWEKVFTWGDLIPHIEKLLGPKTS